MASLPNRVFNTLADFQDANNPVVIPAYNTFVVQDANGNDVCHSGDNVYRPNDRTDNSNYFFNKFDSPSYSFPLTFVFTEVQVPADQVQPDF